LSRLVGGGSSLILNARGRRINQGRKNPTARFERLLSGGEGQLRPSQCSQRDDQDNSPNHPNKNRPVEVSHDPIIARMFYQESMF